MLHATFATSVWLRHTHFAIFTDALFHHIMMLIRSEQEINRLTHSRIKHYMENCIAHIESHLTSIQLPIPANIYVQNINTTESTPNTLNTCIEFLESNHSICHIVGKPGCGKSLLLNSIFLCLAKSYRNSLIEPTATELNLTFQKIYYPSHPEFNRFPIYMDISHSKDQSIREYLITAGFIQSDIDYIATHTQIVLLLDDAEKIRYSLNTLLQDIHCEIRPKIVIGSRSYESKDASIEIKNILREYKSLFGKHTSHSIFTKLQLSISALQLSLNSLNENDIDAYINYHCQRYSLPFQNYAQLTHQYPLLKEIARNPLSLTLLIKSFQFNKQQRVTPPKSSITKAYIYRLYLDAYFDLHYEHAKQIRGIPHHVDFKKRTQEFIYKLARIAKQHPKDLSTYKPFIHDDPVTNTLRELCPVRIQNKKLRFIHDTFQDFLIAEQIFRDLLNNNDSLFREYQSLDDILVMDFLYDLITQYLNTMTNNPDSHFNTLFSPLARTVIRTRKGGKEACVIFESLKGKNEISFAYALLLYEAGQIKKSRKILLNLIATPDKINANNRYRIYCNIANVYLEKKDYMNSKKFLNAALNCFYMYKSINDSEIGFLYNLFAKLYCDKDTRNNFFNPNKAKCFYNLSINEEKRYPQEVKTTRYIGWAHYGSALLTLTYDWDIKQTKNHRSQFCRLIAKQFGEQYLWPTNYIDRLNTLDRMMHAFENKFCYYAIKGKPTEIQLISIRDGKKFIFSNEGNLYKLYYYSTAQQQIITSTIDSTENKDFLNSLKKEGCFYFKEPTWFTEEKKIIQLRKIVDQCKTTQVNAPFSPQTNLRVVKFK